LKGKYMAELELSLVIPVYKASSHIEITVIEISKALEKICKQYEIIFVEDGSGDNTWIEIEKILKKYPNIIAVEMMKNFGQDNAILQGLKIARGENIVIMDDDLQHNPSNIFNLLNHLKLGFDVVYANFEIKKQAIWKNFGSWFNGKVANIVLGKPDELYLSPFKVITHTLKNEIIKYDGPYPYVDGLIFRSTKNIGQITVNHQERSIGKGNYTFWKSFKIWLNLVTSFSIIPLRLAIFTGFFASLLSFLMALTYVIQYFMNLRGPSGWSSLIVTVLFFSGVQLMAIGVLGEYIGRTHLSLNRSPQSAVRKMKYSEVR